MFQNLIALLLLVGNGLVTGVFFAVRVSVLPALATMPAGRYIETHRLLGKGYHPAMPAIVNATTLCAIGLAILTPDLVARLLLVGTVVALLVVQAVSHLGNVPLNRALTKIEPEHVPDDWDDPRPVWSRWHGLRTLAALVAMACSSTTAVVYV
ncbi:anthrone oxygenase family protein [Nocardiopsis alba]|uniref:anthrone oxygenase family protein n=1 Tax=Nocardiopsis alba TaxID=53437 RepID=UPI003D714419